MNFKHFTQAQLNTALGDVNAQYEGNLKLQITRETQRAGNRPNDIRAVLRVHNSSGTGARTAQTGRKGPYATWEAHRDFMMACFKLNPYGEIGSGLAIYKSVTDFVLNHSKTKEGFHATWDKTHGFVAAVYNKNLSSLI